MGNKMKEYYCQHCIEVWEGGDGECPDCESKAVKFDLKKHGRDLIGGNNAFRQVWNEWKTHPQLKKVSEKLGEEGCHSAAAVLNKFIQTLLDENKKCQKCI
jgi:predicted amidophosphoribosyltransferase